MIHATSFISYVDEQWNDTTMCAVEMTTIKNARQIRNGPSKAQQKLNDVCIFMIYVTKFKSGKVERLK